MIKNEILMSTDWRISEKIEFFKQMKYKCVPIWKYKTECLS